MTAVWKGWDNLVRPAARWLQHGHCRRLGIAATMRLARMYNRFKFARCDAIRRHLYRTRMDELLRENGPCTRRPSEMVDGWALDRSMSLPHLDRVLADADKIIAERAGLQITPEGSYRSFFQEMFTQDDVERYPSFVDFATSSDLLATVCRYLKFIPVLSGALPHGIRLVESNAAFDKEPDRPKDSQLYHIDYYSQPNVYVLVPVRDTTPENGPWTFLPRSESQRAARALNNWGYGTGYRFGDDQVYSVADRSKEIAFCGPRGSVLFIESSGCFHFGSRRSIKPRFQLMLGYHGVCRTDFHELLVPQHTYPVRAGDSTLRRLVLDKTFLPPGPAAGRNRSRS